MLMTTARHCDGIGPLDRGACAYAVGDARSAQCYFRKRAALAEALRRVQGVSATNQVPRHERTADPPPTQPSWAKRPAGCRPTLAFWGNAKFAVAAPGSAASTCRRVRHAAERELRITVAPVSEYATSSVRGLGVHPRREGRGRHGSHLACCTRRVPGSVGGSMSEGSMAVMLAWVAFCRGMRATAAPTLVGLLAPR